MPRISLIRAWRFASKRPVSVVIVDVLCVAAALWTVCCHAVVALGGGLRHVVILSALVAAVTTGVVYRFRGRLFSTAPSEESPAPSSTETTRF